MYRTRTSYHLCDAAVAIRELLDKGLMKAPVNQYYKEGEYSAIIDDVVAAWNKEYLQAVEARKAAEQKETPTQTTASHRWREKHFANCTIPKISNTTNTDLKVIRSRKQNLKKPKEKEPIRKR